MKEFPENLKYTKTHEWCRKEDDGTITVGITAHAQDKLGEIVMADLCEEGLIVHGGEEICVLESAKTAIDFYSPISGEVVEVNTDAKNTPSIINQDPYGDGWLLRINPDDREEYEELLDVESYVDFLSEED